MGGIMLTCLTSPHNIPVKQNFYTPAVHLPLCYSSLQLSIEALTIFSWLLTVGPSEGSSNKFVKGHDSPLDSPNIWHGHISLGQGHLYSTNCVTINKNVDVTGFLQSWQTWKSQDNLKLLPCLKKLWISGKLWELKFLLSDIPFFPI